MISLFCKKDKLDNIFVMLIMYQVKKKYGFLFRVVVYVYKGV